MTNEEIIREFSALPSEAKREVVDFIAFLRERYNKKSKVEKSQNITDESFVGMWKDRENLQDGASFVRELRQNEWSK